ncbi:MAG: sulfurtransferase [Gemmatimonadales bacterium]
MTRTPERPHLAAPDLPGLLVDPSWLEGRLGVPGLHVVDLRDADVYESGHIPGAVRLDLADLGTSMGGLDNVLLSPEAFANLMASSGISSGDAVVVYDDQWGLAAARLVWGLHRHGHTAVAVLDGGWDRWSAEGRPVGEGPETEAPPAGARFEAAANADVYADRLWIAERLDGEGAVLLDTRTRAEFEKGHLPGAVSWDWFNAVPPDSWNVSRDLEELRAEWRSLGLDVSDEVIVYCRTGMRAAHTYLVLRSAGFSRVRLYDGSWQEWSMRSMKSEGAGGD